MAVLTAAVVVLGLLCLLNLAVSTAVIRRLRLLGVRMNPVPGAGPAIGDLVPAFDVVAEDGTALNPDFLHGRHTLIAFLSTTCSACVAHAPELALRAAGLGASGTQVLMVLLDDGADARGLRKLLSPAGTLLTGENALAFMTACQVEATPTYWLTGEDGTLVAELQDLDSLPQPLRVD
ncbi:TlpA family protein disulfide reductase [Streptomyces sp. NPDC097595]|uniref:TlpA family protein disulfide reductase n=1 Tax=Streptomyces sp. NPDC097595 TaxID=3366090 RepID=UPI00382C1F66